MQMIVGLIVLVLIAAGVWWYMGSGGTPTTTDTNTPSVVQTDTNQ